MPSQFIALLRSSERSSADASYKHLAALRPSSLHRPTHDERSLGGPGGTKCL
jgi:hypothetical protein